MGFLPMFAKKFVHFASVRIIDNLLFLAIIVNLGSSDFLLKCQDICS